MDEWNRRMDGLFELSGFQLKPKNSCCCGAGLLSQLRSPVSVKWGGNNDIREKYTIGNDVRYGQWVSWERERAVGDLTVMMTIRPVMTFQR